MAINSKALSGVQTDLTTAGTSEVTFKNAISQDVAFQVDENQVDITKLQTTSRTIELTGNVTGSVTYTLNDLDQSLEIATEVGAMTVQAGDIVNNSLSDTQIATGGIGNTSISNNTITSDKIASTSRVRIKVLNSAGTTVRDFYGLTVTV